jgi:hypothetical protein
MTVNVSHNPRFRHLIFAQHLQSAHWHPSASWALHIDS